MLETAIDDIHPPIMRMEQEAPSVSHCIGHHTSRLITHVSLERRELLRKPALRPLLLLPALAAAAGRPPPAWLSGVSAWKLGIAGAAGAFCFVVLTDSPTSQCHYMS
jgi:hypothetical protein